MVAAVISCGYLVLGGCAGQTAESEEDADSVDVDSQDLTSRRITMATGATNFTLKQTTQGDVTVQIDCRPSDNPDDVGTVFKVSAPSLGISSQEPYRASFYSKTTKIPVGNHVLTFTNPGAPASCTVQTSKVPVATACRASTSYRSPNTNHTHIAVGLDASQDWEAFPTSGNHWGAWSKWSTVYDKPIKRGFLLHNLEHGGLVFSYKCNSANDSAACKSARDQLIAIAQTIGPRVLVTPDPTQSTMFGIRAWRWAYTADCLDPAAATAFSVARYRHGREDIDANPPIPFDPTTTNVPCEDLMAAPDSCTPR